MTVRENFLKKKLALTQSGASLDSVIEDICLTTKAEKMKSLVAFYCLLAGKCSKFLIVYLAQPVSLIAPRSRF
ncbi:MAG: DUF2853 family protein [Sulfuriferula sp.]